MNSDEQGMEQLLESQDDRYQTGYRQAFEFLFFGSIKNTIADAKSQTANDWINGFNQGIQDLRAGVSRYADVRMPYMAEHQFEDELSGLFER